MLYARNIVFVKLKQYRYKSVEAAGMRIPSPEELRRLRKKAGLSQRELARLAGVSQSLIAKIEKGEVNPRISTLIKILRVLDEGRKEEPVLKYMHTPVITVKPDTLVCDIVEIMDRHGISQVPVIDEKNRPIGTVYETTIMKTLITHKNISHLKAIDIMEDPLPTVTENASIRTVMQLLIDYPAVLVVDKNGVKGIVTKIDVIKRIVEHSEKT